MRPDTVNPFAWASVGIIVGACLSWNFWVGLPLTAVVLWFGLKAVKADDLARAKRDSVYWEAGVRDTKEMIAQLPSHAEVIRHTQVRNTFDEGVSFAYENVDQLVGVSDR